MLYLRSPVVLVSAFVIAAAFAGGGSAPRLAPRPADPPKKLALLVGINTYRSANIQKLKGCVNDVTALKSVLLDKFGFREGDIRTLTDHEASYDRIVNAFKTHLIARAAPGDIVVFHFSGHGSRVEVGSDPSGFEESIVPYDSRDPKNLDITGSALSFLLRELAKKTKNVTVILDSCHSGRMVSRRMEEVVEVRGIEPATQPAPAPPFPGGATRAVTPGTSHFSPLDDSYVLLAAALAKEYAKEYRARLEQFGAFTHFLVEQLHLAHPDSTYRDIMNVVRVRVSDHVDQQTPQLVGPNGDKYIFGNDNRIAQPYVLVVSSGAGAGSVRLPFAGAAHGVTPGSTYDVFGSDASDFDKEKPLARVEVSRVNPFDSEARILTGSAVPDYSRGILRERKLGSRLRIWVGSTESSQALAAIRRSLSRSRDLELVSDREAAQVQVTEAERQVYLFAPDGRQLSRPIASADPDVDTAVLHQVLQWGRWFALLGLQNPAGGLRVGLSVRPVAGAQAHTSPGRDERPMTVAEGDSIDVTLHNRSNQSVFVSLLVLSSDRSVSVLFPSRGSTGAAVELKPGASQNLDFQPRATLPSCLTATTDHFLLIATTKPIELFPFEQNGICDERPRDRDALQDLLEQGSIGLRGWTKDPGQWTTFRTTLGVQKKGG